MRDIKFRAWHKDYKAMYWFDVTRGNHGRGDGYIGMVEYGKTYESGTDHRGNVRLIDPMDCELMQFTGLLDKNGKEIYEGDVLCCPHYPSNGSWHYLYHKVMWDERLSLFKTVSIGNREGEEITAHGNPMLWVYLKSEKEAEVIGNIYENPELIKQELSS